MEGVAESRHASPRLINGNGISAEVLGKGDGEEGDACSWIERRSGSFFLSPPSQDGLEEDEEGRGGRGDRVQDTFDEWCLWWSPPVGFRFVIYVASVFLLAHRLSPPLPLAAWVFISKWWNRRDVEELRSRDVNYRPVPYTSANIRIDSM